MALENEIDNYDTDYSTGKKEDDNELDASGYISSDSSKYDVDSDDEHEVTFQSSPLNTG